MSPWETLPHPTDLRVRIRGRDRRELFSEAALSTFALSARPRGGWPRELETREVIVEGADGPELLRRLLAECLFELETRGFVAREVHVDHLSEVRCRARLVGARFEPDQLEVENVIKAVTWHGLSIRDEPRGCVAEVLHDL